VEKTEIEVYRLGDALNRTAGKPDVGLLAIGRRAARAFREPGCRFMVLSYPLAAATFQAGRAGSPAEMSIESESICRDTTGYCWSMQRVRGIGLALLASKPCRRRKPRSS